MRFQRVLFVFASLVGLSTSDAWAQTGPDRFQPGPRRPIPTNSAVRRTPDEPPAYSPSITSMKLLTPTTGWAATDDTLFWTTDGGSQWRDTTPTKPSRDRLASVFFLDENRGWVLHAHSSEFGWEFDVSCTSDAGGTWSKTHVASLDLNSSELSGQGWISFADTLHGWLNVGITSSSAFNLGGLLTTSDGGRTWDWVKQGPGVAGTILLLTDKDGWLAGGPGDTELYATHDAGSTWQKTSLQAPKELGSAVYPTYDLPTFEDRLHGFVAVTFSGPEGSKSAAVLYATADGGLTWKPDRTLANLEASSIGQKVASTLADSTWITAVAPAGPQPTLKQLRSNDRVTADVNTQTGYFSGSRVSFVTPTQGWVFSAHGLLSTTDGGATWAAITPGTRGRTNLPRAESETISEGTLTHLQVHQSASRSTLNTTNNAFSRHLGFDKFAVGSTGNMQTWWDSSPYYDVAFYLNGASSHSTDPNLNANWVSSVLGQGWGVIPLWSGLQAPCACHGTGTYPNCPVFPHTFSSNPTTAQSQGVSEADSAIQSATGLNLSATMIFVDIENYSSSACGSAVKAFVTGWVQELHNTNGHHSFFAAGVYGNPGDAATDWVSATLPPDSVWIARYDSGVTVYGLGSGLSDSPWQAARIHQYIGNQSQTWGGVTFQVDADIEDTKIAASGNGVKIPVLGETLLSYPGSNYTYLAGITNGVNNSVAGAQLGEIVGFAQDTAITTMFTYQNGVFTNLNFPGALQSWPVAINNHGTIVGHYANSSNDNHSFVYSNGTFSEYIYPGASVTIVSGINDAGWITGGYKDASGTTHNFLDRKSSHHNLDSIGFPYNVNGSGEIVGFSVNGVSTFLDDAQDSTPATAPVTLLNEGGKNLTAGLGLNNNGQVVGYSQGTPTDTSPDTWAFIYDDNNGISFFSDLVFNWAESFAYAMNDYAQIVGQAIDQNGNYDGFVIKPQ